MHMGPARKDFRAGPIWRLTATLTAMSADDGCGGRVVGVVVRRAEAVAEGVDGLALEAESDVGADASGDADVGVSEEFLDHDEVDPLFQEQGGGAGGRGSGCVGGRPGRGSCGSGG